MQDTDECESWVPRKGAWGVTPPFWDQNLNGTTKKKYAGWTMRFVQINFDGGETYHHFKPRGFACLRVGILGDLQQTATWHYLKPRRPPGVGWALHKDHYNFAFWRRTMPLDLTVF